MFSRRGGGWRETTVGASGPGRRWRATASQPAATCAHPHLLPAHGTLVPLVGPVRADVARLDGAEGAIDPGAALPRALTTEGARALERSAAMPGGHDGLAALLALPTPDLLIGHGSPPLVGCFGTLSDHSKNVCSIALIGLACHLRRVARVLPLLRGICSVPPSQPSGFGPSDLESFASLLCTIRARGYRRRLWAELVAAVP